MGVWVPSMEQGLHMGTDRGMGCSALPGRALPSQSMVTAKSFMKYSLCCLSPLAQDLMELLAPAMQPPVERALGGLEGPPKPAGEEMTFHSCFLLRSTRVRVSGVVVITCLCFSSRRAVSSVVFWKGRLAARPAVVTQDHPTTPRHLLLLLLARAPRAAALLSDGVRMLCQRRMQVVLALCLLLVLWQCFQAPRGGISPFPQAPSHLDAPAAYCTTSTNGSMWFNARYNRTMGPLLTGRAHELPSDVVQWWLTLQGPSRGVQLQAILWQLFTVLPAPTGSLWDPNHCRTCAVVGNSRWLKDSGHGLRIDAHDWVLRMNRAKIAGFELDVGMRTTHHFMYPESAVDLEPGVHLILVPFKPLDLQWVASAFSTGELTHTYTRVKRFIKADRNKVLILSPAFLKYIHDNWTQHHGRYPSTGFTALLFALHACQQVSVFGFGADTKGNWHHYWEKNRWSGAFRRTGVHDADTEFSLIERLAAEGRILFHR